jgi:haloacetate dehalogenase
MMTFEDFEAAEIRVEDTTIFVRRAGSGPGLLLLHGFPQTHLMWRAIAPRLATSFTVICADLRGYGGSGCPPSGVDHAAYAKRAMAKDMIEVMATLGFQQFFVAGHDRGGRVAYRLALDHPAHIRRLAVLDVLPVADVWVRANREFALGYWPWSLLAQAEPLPERLVGSAPDAIVDAALGGWGSPRENFSAEIRDAYVEALRDSAHVHAICEEYRAAASIDDEHDRADRTAGRKIECPLLVLWSGKGPLDSWYRTSGGPLAIWRVWATDVRGRPIDGGHFFPEEFPEQTAGMFADFFADEAVTPRYRSAPAV